MKFIEWIRLKEEAESAPVAAVTAAQTTPAPSVNLSSTITSDIAKVPQRMFSKQVQTSDNCRNCSKDWKNWHYTKKKKNK